MQSLAYFILSLQRRWTCAFFQLALITLLFSVFSVNASPILVPRAVVRPIPMPGFNVSVFDDTTGALVPQAQASDGGGLINGRVFSAPNMIWAITTLAIGSPLSVFGVRLWRVTTALGGGLSLAFAMWIALINTISEAGLASSTSMSDILIILITGAAFLVGAIGGAFRLMVVPAMAATCVLGGTSIAIRGIILRPGLLVPPGLNRQLAFVNLVIVAAGALLGGLSIILKRRESMIFSTASVGSFLIALTVDLLVNGQNGMSRGLRSLFDMNDNHIADLVGGGYNPPLSSQVIVASSVALIPILALFQHFVFPGSFQRPRPRKRTQFRIESSPEAKGAPTSPSKPDVASVASNVAPGPTWRTSVLSLFRVPGRSSNTISSQYSQYSVDSRDKGTIPTKLANEGRGSTAYNYHQGIYALPSEILRQQSQSRELPSSRQNTNALKPNLHPPPLSVVRERPAQFAGVGLRVYRDLRYSRTPNGFSATRGALTRDLRIPRTGDSDLPNAQPISRSDGQPTPTNTQRASHGPTSRIQQLPTAVTLAPSSTDAVPVSTPRTGIGLGMLRMSVDSIIDAYGETNDPGYRYGGSRTGDGGRI